MVLLKARAMPTGAIRHYANGETFRKVGGTKGWEYVGKMGSAKAKAAEEEARKNGLPIIHAEPKAGGGQQQPQKPSTSKASTNIAVDPAKVKAHPIPPDLRKEWQANGGVNNPEYRKWVEENWAQGAEEKGIAFPRMSTYEKMSVEQMYNYASDKFKVSIEDKITKENKAAWHSIFYQLDTLHDLGFINKRLLTIGFEKDALDKDGNLRLNGGLCKAYYQENEHRIELSPKYKDSFVHEYFHHLDATGGAEDYKERMEAQLALINALKATKSYQKFVALDIKRGKTYYSDVGEMIARLGAEYVYYHVKNSGEKPAIRMVQAPYRTDFSPSEFVKLKPLLEKAFAKQKTTEPGPEEKKQGILIKATLDVTARLVLAKPTVYYSLGEEDLYKGAVVKVQDMPGAKSGKTQKLILLSPTGTIVEAAWKTKQDRDVRKGNIPAGTEWKRERLAYLVSEILGLQNVPPVVVRRVDGKIGSAMSMVYADTWKASGLEYKDVYVREWQKLAVLDWLICATDRHRRNWLVDDSGKFWAIDNDLSFPEKAEYGLFEGYRSRPHWYLNEHQTLALMDDIVRLFSQEKKREILVQMVKYGIASKGRVIFARRWEYLVAEKALPPYVELDKGFMEKPKGE
ncbi:MAG: hypothetical protein C4K49_10660 [Candidatus Thorarchaeota archaeon]|nr:MAG: hypothetical protein C4K49_10660 [Candidatus Thorarchaeota archaeon]